MHLEIRQEAVQESNDEARIALERVATTLKQTKTVSRRHPERRKYVGVTLDFVAIYTTSSEMCPLTLFFFFA